MADKPTLDEFRNSRREVADLRDVFPADDFADFGDEKPTGFVYVGVAGEKWWISKEPDGTYYCFALADFKRSRDLTKVEKWLWKRIDKTM